MSIADVRNPNSLSGKLRARRDFAVRNLIQNISAKIGAVEILDMGGSPYYWDRLGLDFLRQQNARVTIVNIEPSELWVTNEAPDIFTQILGDACNLSEYEDNSFSMVHSNSVLEHVLTWSNMKAFAKETRRLAPYYYVQTPYFWFPLDPHHYRMPFYHWLPSSFRATLLLSLPLTAKGRIRDVDTAYAVLGASSLLDARQFRFLFPDGRLTFERFLGLPKSMITSKAP